MKNHLTNGGAVQMVVDIIAVLVNIVDIRALMLINLDQEKTAALRVVTMVDIIEVVTKVIVLLEVEEADFIPDKLQATMVAMVEEIKKDSIVERIVILVIATKTMIYILTMAMTTMEMKMIHIM